MTTRATHNPQDTPTEGTLFVAFELRGYPETIFEKRASITAPATWPR